MSAVSPPNVATRSTLLRDLKTSPTPLSSTLQHTEASSSTRLFAKNVFNLATLSASPPQQTPMVLSTPSTPRKSHGQTASPKPRNRNQGKHSVSSVPAAARTAPTRTTHPHSLGGVGEHGEQEEYGGEGDERSGESSGSSTTDSDQSDSESSSSSSSGSDSLGSSSSSSASSDEEAPLDSHKRKSRKSSKRAPRALASSKRVLSLVAEAAMVASPTDENETSSTDEVGLSRGGSKNRHGKPSMIPSSTSSRASSKPLTERQQMALILKQEREAARSKSTQDKIHSRNERGETPLHTACIKGDFQLAVSLVRQGADVNAKDHAGWTPLHEASNHGYAQIANWLLQHGAFPTAPGLNDDTPLHDASINGHVAVAVELLQFGADPFAPNKQGKTPVDVAYSDEMRELLLKGVSVWKSLHGERSGSDLTRTAESAGSGPADASAGNANSSPAPSSYVRRKGKQQSGPATLTKPAVPDPSAQADTAEDGQQQQQQSRRQQQKTEQRPKPKQPHHQSAMAGKRPTRSSSSTAREEEDSMDVDVLSDSRASSPQSATSKPSRAADSDATYNLASPISDAALADTPEWTQADEAKPRRRSRAPAAGAPAALADNEANESSGMQFDAAVVNAAYFSPPPSSPSYHADHLPPPGDEYEHEQVQELVQANAQPQAAQPKPSSQSLATKRRIKDTDWGAESAPASPSASVAQSLKRRLLCQSWDGSQAAKDTRPPSYDQFLSTTKMYLHGDQGQRVAESMLQVSPQKPSAGDGAPAQSGFSMPERLITHDAALFAEQERERRNYILRHAIERERLVLSAENKARGIYASYGRESQSRRGALSLKKTLESMLLLFDQLKGELLVRQQLECDALAGIQRLVWNERSLMSNASTNLDEVVPKISTQDFSLAHVFQYST